MSKRASPCVELSATALQHTRAAMKVHDQPQRPKPESAGARDGVRWRQDRGAWLAVKQSEDGKRIHKTFRPEDESEESHQRAKERAKAWITSDETGDGEEPEEVEPDQADHAPEGGDTH